MELEVDSKVAISLTLDAGKGMRVHGQLFWNIRRWLAIDWQVRITHIYREANS